MLILTRCDVDAGRCFSIRVVDIPLLQRFFVGSKCGEAQLKNFQNANDTQQNDDFTTFHFHWIVEYQVVVDRAGAVDGLMFGT